MPELGAARVLVVHDWIVPWGGAERCLAEILQVVPGADLIVGVRLPRMANFNDTTRRARETWLRRIPFAQSHHRWFVPLHYAAFSSIDTRSYDLIISSSFSFAKAVRATAGRPHLCYCYSPPRYLWDMADTYLSNSGPLSAAALRLSSPLLRILDRRSARGVTRFVAISRFVADRIRLAYGRPASVVYPPIAAKRRRDVPTPVPQREGFLLVVSRLVTYKRIDLAIAAVQRLGLPLVVAGDGPDRRRLEGMAGHAVTFLGRVDEETAANLLDRCRLFLFTAEEDFGIAPLEANAHGAPVVGYGRGGLAETMVPGSTAEFFEHQTIDSVVAAIERALRHSWDAVVLRQNADRFTAARFREAIAREVLLAVNEA